MRSVQPRGAALAVAVLVAGAVLLGGCASAPQSSVQKEGSALTAPTALAAPGSPPAPSGGDRAPTGAAASSIAPPETLASADGASDSLSVVDLSKRPLDEAENSGQICRQMLKPNTNSMITVCGTAAQWKKFKAAEAAQAEDNLLRWQAGRF